MSALKRRLEARKDEIKQYIDNQKFMEEHEKEVAKRIFKTKKEYKPKNVAKLRADLEVPKKGRPRVTATLNISGSIDDKTKRALKKAIMKEVNKKIKMSGSGMKGAGLRKEIKKLLEDDTLLEVIVKKVKKDGKTMTEVETDFKEGLNDNTINKIIEAGINSLNNLKPSKPMKETKAKKEVKIKEEPKPEPEPEPKAKKETFMSFVKKYKEDNDITTTIKELAKQDNVKKAWKNRNSEVEEPKKEESKPKPKPKKETKKAEPKPKKETKKAEPKPKKETKKAEPKDDYLAELKADILGAKEAEKPKALTDFKMPKLSGDKWAKRDTLMNALEERTQAYIQSRGNKTIKKQMEDIEKAIIKVQKS